MNVSDLKTQKRIRHLLKSANAQGWQTRRGGRNWVATSPMTLYVFDLATGYLASAVLNAEEFNRVAESEKRGTPEQLCEDAATMIASMADGKVPPHLQQDATTCMFSLACRYAGITQTFQLTQVEKGTHFFVLLYRHLGQKSLTLRPFATRQSGADGMLDTEVVRNHIKAVISVDRDRHPDWLLPLADVIPFKGRLIQ